MRAALYAGNGTIVIDDRPAVAPGAGEVPELARATG